MSIELPKRDPSAAHVRKAIAARRVGAGSRCPCGEARPEALVRKGKSVICHDCKRKEKGMKRHDNHHVYGKANDPATVSAPVNDHRAELNTAQHDWPKKTLQNPDGSPLLKAAACVRGFIDTVVYLIKSGLLLVADLLEKADALLAGKFGSKWWIGTELESYAPKK